MKRRLNVARTSALALSTTGALFATASGTILRNNSVWRPWCAGMGAISLAVATFITSKFLTADALRRWTRTRSVSEGIKHHIYACRAGAAPFNGKDAALVLQSKVESIEANATDLERYLADTNPKISNPPPLLTPAEYIRLRVQQQIDGYYRPKARLFSKRLRQLRGLELILGLTATILATLGTFLSNDAAQHTTLGGFKTDISSWVAVLTTTAGAFAAHIAANRYDFTVMSYFATARRLEDLVNAWRARDSPTDEIQWSNFVNACENAISVENESWMAKWAEQGQEAR
jgi:SMODS and SLOG-associating 2TM effector domain 1/Protein of unknown function (DUF4231)